jgi:uncharacterized protein YcnI
MSKTTKTLGATALAIGTGAVIALTPALAASAHVTASASSTAAGSYSVVTFSVPHGCEGSPTTGIEIQVPETILSVTPTVNPNWTVEKQNVTLEEPLEGPHGETITERVASVVYTTTGAGLADGYRDTFDVQVLLPEGEAGDAVEFPVLQTCAEGTAEWVGDDVPTIVLSAAAEGDEHGHGDASGDEATTASGDDVLARVLGIGGLVVGSVGLVVGVTARRRSA